MNLQWWCSATGQPWTWAWRWYPGVWLFLALLGFWYLRVVAPYGRSSRTEDDSPAGHSSHRLWFLTGLIALWVALDWPVGALGAGYLASAHTVSYILLSFIAPPCLILGLPAAFVRQALGTPFWGRLLRTAARPWLALAAFDTIVLLTHVPNVVDTLMVTQIGSLLVDLSWLVGGMLLWWPVMGPPEVVRLQRPMKMVYLFVSTLAPIIPSAFLTFAQYPLYATYEMAPRIFRLLTAQQDQQVAGLLMKIVGDLPVWFAFGVIFFRWAKEGEQHPPPVHPGAVREAVSRGPSAAGHHHDTDD